MRSATALLRDYRKRLSLKNTPFLCPHCNDSILYKCFESHCSSTHHLNPRICCVWCSGKVSWDNREKAKHLDHIVPCWQKFMLQINYPLPDIPITSRPHPILMDMTPMDRKHCLFDHDFNPPPRAYDPVWPMPLDPNLVTFQGDGLDRAASCVRKYLELGDQVEWFHIMVRTIAFPSFLQAMDADDGRSRTLPFSCWCDGGKPPDPRHRQHRHMIVVSSPPGHFKRNVWSNVSSPPEDRPRQNFRAHHCEPITSAMHFVNTLGYLCKQTSKCNFSGDRSKATEKQNHFYLFEELPTDYRLPLVLQWDDGIRELLNQDFRNLKRVDLVRAPVHLFQGKWHFTIQHIPGIVLNTVLPVTRDLQPCPHETGAALHLLHGRTLHFERNPELCHLTPEEWLERQTELGNLFYYVVGNDAWTPRPFHQGLLNDFKPIVDRHRELETNWTETVDTLKRKHAAAEEEAVHWKQAYNALNIRNMEGKQDSNTG